MIPYLLPAIPGELFYSRIVRTMQLCDGTLSSRHIGAWLLGDGLRRIGARLPQHGRRLLEKIPPVYGVTAPDLLRDSLLPAVAPFLDAAQRERLVNECIESPAPQVARWFSINGDQQSRCLKFCPRCTQEDRDRGVPLHWRTAHQYPNSAACVRHGILLMSAPAAVLGKDCLHDPSLHIVPHADVIQPAGAADRIIARDLHWLLEENTLNPGRTRMKAALRMALSEVQRYPSRDGNVSAAKVLADLQALIGSPGSWNGARPLAQFTLVSTSRTMSRARYVPAFYEYSLLGALIGLPLPELMARATALPEEKFVR